MRDSTVPNISPMHFCYGTREILPIEHEMLRESGWICKTVLRLQIPKAGLPRCMSWKWRKDTCTRPARIHCNQTKKNTPRGGRRFQLKVTNSDKIGFVHLSSCFHYDAKATPETSSRPADNASHCVSRAMGIPALGLLHRVARSIRVVNSLGQ